MKEQIRKHRKIKPGVKLFLMVLPIMVMYYLLCYRPLAGWLYAFWDYKPGRSLADCEYKGMYYFTLLFKNPLTRKQFYRALRNTLIMSGIGVATSFLPMFFAIGLNEMKSLRLKKVIQTVTTIPHFVSWVIVYSLAFAMFSVEAGAFNIVLKKIGIIKESINFLATGKYTYLTTFLWSTWKGIGWSAVIYFSALSGIDQELLDAASIDGAGKIQKIRYITIPSLMPTFLTLLILSIGNLLNSGMDMQLLFMNESNTEYLVNLDYFVYDLGLGQNMISLSTAIGMMKSIVAVILLFFSNWVSGRVREEKII